MTRYLLDTNTCIYFLNRASQKLIDRFQKHAPSQITLSAITVAELYYGAEKSKAQSKNMKVVESFVSTFQIISFNKDCSRTYATIRTSLEKAGTPIGPMDLLIASIGLTNNLVVVTNHQREFKRVEDLAVENWL